MIYRSITYVVLVMVLYALLSGRLSRSPITGPMYFTAAGLIGAGIGAWDPLLETADASIILEITLGLVLFTEAMKLRLVSWSEDFELATRLLVVGMPLTIVVGAIAAIAVFPGMGLAAAAVIATVLAPTDAALGLAVVENPKVPKRIREALAVESGLNDGIALPILLFFLAVLVEGGARFGSLFLEAVGVAVAVGLIFGTLVGLAMRDASRRGWMQGRWQQITVVIVPVVSLVVADALGGSGFIATFVAGLAFGHAIRGMDEEVADFGDDLSTFLTMFAFMLFGGVFLAVSLGAFSARTIVYAVLSLTIVRMLPVAVSMMKTGYRWPSTTFMGWFGPRGLASIIFAAVVVEEVGFEQSEVVVATMVVTVTLSVLLHGATAYHGAEAYGDWTRDRPVERP